ncbi:chemotaxis protein CheW [Oceanobacter antarcticus]|uniref:Chemotaxis protein CheW n=1 Tax=Oceanobacter antarcticus TaxID=3133425 RepID=A0ABW8NLP4_9GAMM
MATKKRQNLVDGVLQDYLDDLLGLDDVFADPASDASAVDNSGDTVGGVQPCVLPDPFAPAKMSIAVDAILVPGAAKNVDVSQPAGLPRFADPPAELTPPLPDLAVAKEVAVAVPALTIPDLATVPAMVVPHDVIQSVSVEPANVTLNPSRSTEVADTEHRHELDGKSDLASLNWQSGNGVDCLLFTVSGLKLAIPLPLLGGVHKVNERVTPLFGQASWSLGVWQGDDLKLTIIDSAQLIMPERGTRLADDGYDYFIQLDRSPWALACQDILDTVKLDNNAIKWRGEASKRRWLAGTVIKEMCALIDVPGLLQLLENSRRKGSLNEGAHVR